MYNQKVRIFNVSNLPLIEEMLEPEDYALFVKYIKDRVVKKGLVLFSTRIKNYTLYCESLENTFPEPDKTLSLENPNNN